MVWNSLVPPKESSPLKATLLTGEQFAQVGPAHGSMARLKDGRLFLAFTSGDWQQHQIRFTTSRDGEVWEPSWNCLLLGLGDYLQLLDWTGRQIRSGRRGAMPTSLEPMFERGASEVHGSRCRSPCLAGTAA